MLFALISVRILREKLALFKAIVHLVAGAKESEVKCLIQTHNTLTLPVVSLKSPVEFDHEILRESRIKRA